MTNTESFRCPRCKTPQPGFRLDANGRIVTESGVIVISYYCENCKKVIHWHLETLSKRK